MNSASRRTSDPHQARQTTEQELMLAAPFIADTFALRTKISS